MKFYSAGNFVLLSKKENEERFKKLSESVYGKGSYKRLTSFFFRKETDVVLSVKENDG